MKKVIQTLLMSLIMTSSILAQDCGTSTHHFADYVVSGNFTQKNSGDTTINDVVMLTNNDWAQPAHFRINMLMSDGNGRDLKNGTNTIYYDLNNVDGRMVRGDFDNDGHIDDFILINKTGASSMRFDLFESDGHNSHPSFTQSNGVYTLNGYDPDKITGRVVSGDFDGDGFWDDIATFYDYGNGETRIHTFRSNGSTFVYSSSVGWWNSTGYTAGRVTDRVISGDFDHDGKVDDIAAFYDYGGGNTRIHVWLSNGSGFSYQYSTGWWVSNPFTDFTASKISKRVVSLNIDRDGNNYSDIAVFYETGFDKVKMHVFRSDGPSFKLSTGVWGDTTYRSSFLNGRIAEYDSRKNFQGKTSDIIGFFKNKNTTYELWKSKNTLSSFPKIEYSRIPFCGAKSNIEGAPTPKDQVITKRESTVKEESISAYPNPTKSTSTIEMPESFIDDTSRIEIHDFFGRLVFSDKIISSTIKIDLSKEDPGIYMVKVIGRVNSNILRIVKE